MHHFSQCPSVIQLESCRSTITIENLLHFLKYFDESKICMKTFLLGFVKFPSTHLSSGFFAQMQKDLNEKNCASIFSHLESCHVHGQVRFQVSSIINVTGVVKMDRVRSCCSKTAEENEENEENAIKRNASSNIRTLNSLHQVNIMLLELDLRMLLYFFCRKLSVVRKNIKLFFS